MKIIVAFCKNNGIGKNNSLPWKLKKDLLYFKNKTILKYSQGQILNSILNLV